MKKSKDMVKSLAPESREARDAVPRFDFDLSSRWVSGIPYEVAFWRSYYRNKGSRNDLLSWSQYGRECSLDNFDVAAFVDGLNREDPVIADVGCALSYMFSDITFALSSLGSDVLPLIPLR